VNVDSRNKIKTVVEFCEVSFTRWQRQFRVWAYLRGLPGSTTNDFVPVIAT